MTAALITLFRQAATEMSTRGHHQGHFTCPTGEVCTVGALSVAVTGNPVPAEKVDASTWAAIEYLSPRIDSNIVDEDPIERIADWNDRTSTTPSDVLAVLEAAANALEAELAEADLAAHRTFGRDETRWTKGQGVSYMEAIATVYQQHGQAAA
ncbi:hypothetical protein ACIQ7D_18125 [Streptomyces sp. NPDC096310]|uniref:DUF6197 family protein n=1 Tax=Streptomyces sp. NPDC096310 TaxID=3366082 RepID=UPI0038164668